MNNYLSTDSNINPNIYVHLHKMTTAAQMLLSETDKTTERKRIHFDMMSNTLYALLKDAGLKNVTIYHQYCPMAFNDQGAYWLSKYPEIENPYFGDKMLECGEITDTLQ